MSALAFQVREALRRLHRCDGVTIGDLAAAARVQPLTIERLASKEGWTRAGGTGAATPADRVSALADRLIREVEAIEREAQGGVYDKLRIESVTALTRALEKLSDFAQGETGKQEAAKKTDDEIAAALARIDERIVELALDYAERMVREDAGPARAAAGGK